MSRITNSLYAPLSSLLLAFQTPLHAFLSMRYRIQ